MTQIDRSETLRVSAIVRICAIVLLTVGATAATAVMRSADGVGQVAIVPVFTTESGVDTLLKIDARWLPSGAVNRDASVVRVQFRGPDGAALEAFNVYLSGPESWIAAVTAGPDGPQLVIPDESCVLGDSGGARPVVVQSGVPISGAYGYLEVLEMGTVPTAEESPYTWIRARECDALAGEFADGDWAANANAGVTAPSGRLRVSASLIDVERGTQYSTGPVHLKGFRDAPFHVAPQDAYGLADARDSGTSSGATRSVVCQDECTTEEWATPIDAVASTLIAQSLEADFVVNDSIRASSIALVLGPLEPYYPEGHPATDSRFALWPRGTDPLGVGVPCIITPPPGNVCPYLPFGGPAVLDAISIEPPPDDTPVPETVPILGLPGEFPTRQSWLDANSTTGIPATLDSGAIWIFGLGGQWLTSNDGTRYFGQPSLMIVLTELVNGQLFDDQGQSIRSNYGETSVASRYLESVEPAD